MKRTYILDTSNIDESNERDKEIVEHWKLIFNYYFLEGKQIRIIYWSSNDIPCFSELKMLNPLIQPNPLDTRYMLTVTTSPDSKKLIDKELEHNDTGSPIFWEHLEIFDENDQRIFISSDNANDVLIRLDDNDLKYFESIGIKSSSFIKYNFPLGLM